ncbi:hypothetical protein [uncultured Meiothermus sp.]|nr:hypothetical protein [uncultured Meiothermus sp.]
MRTAGSTRPSAPPGPASSRVGWRCTLYGLGERRTGKRFHAF